MIRTAKQRQMSSRNQIAVVAGLMLLACVVQVVTIRRATVTGLDAVRFVASAKMIDQHGLVEALRGQREQPLFPVSVWAIHRAVEQTAGDFHSSWALSSQLAAAAALVLSVVPVYFVAKRLVGATAAAWGTVFYCVLPEVARLGADGISDSLHLLFFGLAFWTAIVYLTGAAGSRGAEAEPIGSGWHPTGCGNPVWLLPAGVATGFAVLVRAEALVLPVALVLAWLLFQIRADRRQQWRRISVAAGLFGMGFCLVIAPYLAVVDSVAPKAAVARVLGRYDPPDTEAATADPVGAAAWYLDDGKPMSFAKKDPTVSLRRRGLLPAAGLFIGELVRAYGYWVGLLALAGTWRLRLTRPGRAGTLAIVYFAVFSAAAFHFAVGEGYLSARHLLPLVLIGVGSVGYGVQQAGRWLTAYLTRRLCRAGGEFSAKQARWISTAATIAVVAGWCLFDSVQPVHASREGHRRAAAWLAENAPASGSVLDTRGWTGLYSGRTTYGYEQARAAFGGGKLAYVVLEDRELKHASERSRTLRRLLDVAAEPVTRFPGPHGRGYTGHGVVVYRWSAQRFSQWLESRAAVQRARGM